MTFWLTGRDVDHKHFDDHASYTVSDYGVLTVLTGEGLRVTYSPSGWFYVEDETPPKSTAVRVR